MTDMELAEEIERMKREAGGRNQFALWLLTNVDEIIAALRRVPSDDPMSSGYIPLCAGHAETWFTGRDHLKDGMKATCVVCAFERPPSGEMVTDAMIEAGKNERMECFKTEGRETNPISVGEALTRIYRAMLSAAEAEGRKS